MINVNFDDSQMYYSFIEERISLVTKLKSIAQQKILLLEKLHPMDQDKLNKCTADYLEHDATLANLEGVLKRIKLKPNPKLIG